MADQSDQQKLTNISYYMFVFDFVLDLEWRVALGIRQYKVSSGCNDFFDLPGPPAEMDRGKGYAVACSLATASPIFISVLSRLAH